MSISKTTPASNRFRELVRTALLLSASVLCIATDALAQAERIDRYDSRINVLEDGSLAVTETIAVTAAGDKIKRGIYRDFPTMYTTKYFIRIELPFTVNSVKRDGRPEPYHTENVSNGVRLYIGDEDVKLSPGQYEYEIQYTTNYQLGYFDDHDELYWNVTGNGWDFAIDQVTAAVHLPADVSRDDVTHESYTGPEGSQENNATSSVDDATGAIEFVTTKPLGSYEGLTIVVGFPKGFVREPTDAERRQLFLKANRTLWAVLGGLLVLLAYYWYAWMRVGRDPPGGAIVPQFEPPEDLAPACLRYLLRMGYDKTCFTAAVLSMASKGWLRIEEDDGEYKLQQYDAVPQRKLSSGEKAAFKKLMSAGSLQLKQINHARIKEAIERLGEHLDREFEGKLFLKNRGWLIPGWILSAAVVAVAALSCGWQALPIVGFMSIWLSIWSVGVFFLGSMVVAAWQAVFALRRSTFKRLGSFGGALFITAFATPFFLGEVMGLGMLISGTSIWMLPLFVGVIGINWGFWHWIKQPTLEGRRIMDDIEGFRMYLGAAEQERLRLLHPPDETPELFEKYLPYALALEVEHEWAERFVDVLKKASTDPSSGNGHYHPSWYSGRHWNPASAGAFATGLGSSLGSAISSSSTAPGSSSGGGGGGSSGGGGGGGGGGGW